jgi:DNA polymerase-3 subunit delta
LLYILWGEDEFSREEALTEIKKSLGDISLLSTNTNVLEGQKLNLNDLRAVVEAMPFLSPKRLVIIRGLLERFEPKDKSGRAKKATSTAKKESESSAVEALAGCIKGMPESTVLVLYENIEAKKTSLQNNPLFELISEKAELKPFPRMAKGIKLSQWIQSRITREGGSISRQATNVLMDMIGGDLFTMSNEVSKLAAFTGGRMIEEKDIRMVVSATQEADIFAMIDAIMDRKPGIAEQILQKLLQNGRAPQEILALLAKQAQMLVVVKDLKSQKRPAGEIQARLGLFNSFVWEKMSARAEKYTLDRLKEIYSNLLETDLAIKTGKFEGDLAINILIADLCESKK